METKLSTEFPEDIETDRRALYAVLRAALETNTLAAIRSAQDRLRDWLQMHPEDYIMRDAGEPLAMTEDALLALEHEQYAATAS